MAAEADPSATTPEAATAFAQFVDALTHEAGGVATTIQLVIVGDMLNLTRVMPGVAADEAVATSLMRLDAIAAAHERVFEALGRFAAAGGTVRLIIGNHDLDLAHPALQERFIGWLGLQRASDEHPAEVTFHPWFFHVRDLLYAEHGHRYHDINAARVPDGQQVPGVHSPADTPFTAYVEALIQALRTRRSNGTSATSLVAQTVSRLIRHRDSRSMDRSVAAQHGLDRQTRLAIDALVARVGASTFARAAAVILIRPIATIAPYGVVAAVLGLILRGHRRAVAASVAATSMAALIAFVRDRRRLWPPPRSTRYASDAARALHDVLNRGGWSVPFYVLGHTHVPARTMLDGRDRPAIYLNTGAWTAPDSQQREYPFIRLSRAASGEVGGELLWWSVGASASARADEAALRDRPRPPLASRRRAEHL